MKLWRFNVLIELYECAPDAYILSKEPRNPHIPPTIIYSGVRGAAIPWRLFNELVDTGDIVQFAPDKPQILDDSFVLQHYRLSDAGRQALESLPNFERRLDTQSRDTYRQKRVMA